MGLALWDQNLILYSKFPKAALDCLYKEEELVIPQKTETNRFKKKKNSGAWGMAHKLFWNVVVAIGTSLEKRTLS